MMLRGGVGQRVFEERVELVDRERAGEADRGVDLLALDPRTWLMSARRPAVEDERLALVKEGRDDDTGQILAGSRVGRVYETEAAGLDEVERVEGGPAGPEARLGRRGARAGEVEAAQRGLHGRGRSPAGIVDQSRISVKSSIGWNESNLPDPLRWSYAPRGHSIVKRSKALGGCVAGFAIPI